MTVNAASPSETESANSTAAIPDPGINAEKNAASCQDTEMDQIKQNAVNRIQQAESEKEVREEYQDFLKQAEQTKKHPAHRKPCARTYNKPTRVSRPPSQQTSRQFVAKLPAEKKTHKPTTKLRRKKPVKKQEKKIIKNEAKEKKNVCPTKKSKERTHNNSSASDPFPALVLISSFLSFALVKLSTIGRSTSASVTFIELSSPRR